MGDYQFKCRMCGKLATWECSGELARFGIPLETYYCNECKPKVKPRPKIMAYNKFPLKWTQLHPDYSIE